MSSASPLLFNKVLAVLIRALGKIMGGKAIYVRKEEVRLFLFVDDMISHIENPKEPIPDPQKKQNKKTISTNKVSKAEGYTINTQKSLVLLLRSNQQYHQR